MLHHLLGVSEADGPLSVSCDCGWRKPVSTAHEGLTLFRWHRHVELVAERSADLLRLRAQSAGAE